MKTLLQLFITTAMISCGVVVNAQDKSFHSMQDAIDDNIAKLKTSEPDYSNIFVVISADEKLVLSDKVANVKVGLNGKFLHKKDKNFLVEVKVSSQTSQLVLEIVNYSIAKVNNRRSVFNKLAAPISYPINP